MKLAMSNIAWAPAERIAAYGCLAQAGIPGLEIAPGLFFADAEDPFLPDAALLRTALSELTDHGLSLVSMQSLLFGVSGAELFGDPAARQALETGMERAIELAGRLGIANLVFGSPGQRRVPEQMALEEALQRGAELFRRLGDRAAAAGTKIAIEANPAAYGTNFLTDLDAAHNFVRQTDHPAIVAILDLGAMHMNGCYAQLPDRIPGLMADLNHVHVSEPHLAPAPASVEGLLPVLESLRAHGYQKAVSIEMKRPEQGLAEVERAVARLAAAYAQMDPPHA